MRGICERSKELGFTRPSALCSKKFFMHWLIRQPQCSCCGCAFDIGPKNGHFRNAGPSIDRFDCSRGYDLENIELICWRCNNIKRNYVAADLLAVAGWMGRRVPTWGNQAKLFDPEVSPHGALEYRVELR